MKKFFFICLATASITAGCKTPAEPISPTPPNPPEEETEKVTVVATLTDTGFTPAEKNGEENFSFRNGFTTGDRAGLYIIKDGQLIGTNLPLTYDGTVWKSAETEYIEGATYYIYYPRQEDDYMEDKIVPEANDADAFFGPVKEIWQAPAEQGNITGTIMPCDLTYATGTAVTKTDNTLSVSAALQHVMAVALWELPAGTKYTTPDGFSYQTPSDLQKVTYTLDGTKIQPGSLQGKFCFLYNPIRSSTIEITYTLNNTERNYTLQLDNEAGSYTTTLIDGGAKDGGTRAIAIGDLFYKDGSILPAEEAAKLPDGGALPGVAGIVFQTDPNRFSEAEKELLGTVHGLVVSTLLVPDISDPNGYMFWYFDKAADNWIRDESEEDPAYPGMYLPNIIDNDCVKCFELADADINGYANNRIIQTRWSEDFIAGWYPAFSNVADFENTVSVQDAVTSWWYLPSNGQWFDILRNLGGAELTSDGVHDYGGGDFYFNDLGELMNTLNASISKVAEAEKTPFSLADSYWTSSPCAENAARILYFYADGYAYCCLYGKNGACQARAVLSF